MLKRRLVVGHVRAHTGKENIAFVPRIQIPVETVPRQVTRGQHCDSKSTVGKEESTRPLGSVGEGERKEHSASL